MKAVMAGLLLSGAVTSGLAATTTTQAEFPFTRVLGRAASEYRDKDIHVVAAYYYSQRNHDSRWLMIETAVSARQVGTIHRDDIVLRTPEGREIPVATQSRFAQDISRIRLLLQNAAVSRHAVSAYFTQRDRVEGMRLFALPFGGVVHDDFVVDDHRVARGDLFFEAPTGRWDEGTYSLVIRHEHGEAALPIELE